MSSQSAQWVATARLVRRLGLGATGAQIDGVLAGGWARYLQGALGSDPDADPGAAATPLPSFPVLRAPGKTATAQARKTYRGELADQLSTLASWWLRRMVAVEQPAHEKLTLIWHNHFATSAAKVRSAALMAGQNQTLRTLKLGDFRTLAYAMLTDAAMLRWLDAATNTAKAANENLAREFLEVFALGHGNGYTEADVLEGARALTGWTVDPDGRTALVAKRHDDGPKTVLGVSGALDAAGFCDAVLGHPNSARFVADRLWRGLASDSPPSPAARQRILSAYGQGRDLSALTTAILTDPEVTGSRGTIVTAPAEWLIGVIRSLRVPLESPEQLKVVTAALKTLGQRPFYPPDVGGWPYGQAWLSTGAAGVRLQTAAALAARADLTGVAEAAPADRIDAAGYLIGVGCWTDRSAAALKPLVTTPAALMVAAVNTPEYLTA